MSKAKKDKEIDDTVDDTVDDNAEFDELAKRELEKVKNADVPMKWEKAKVQKLNTGMMRIRQQKFLKAFAECGNRKQSLDAAGINAYTEQRWRSSGDKWYIERFKEAQETFKDSIGAVVKDRAIEGVSVPVIGKKLVFDASGNPLGMEDQILTDENGQPLYKKVYDSNLLMFYAKKVDPTFKEKYEEPRDADQPNENTSPMHRITIQLNMMRERQNQRIIDITPTRKELTDGEVTEVTIEETNG